MWQHRWALWSGLLGATASCFVKMVSSNSPVMIFVQKNICEEERFSWLIDLDEILVGSIHYVLGELMIKRRINLMPYWKLIKTSVIEELAIRFDIFEVDYSRLFIIFPVQLFCVVAMITTNAYMIASFLRGIQESGSIAGTSLSTAANFVASAMFGKLFFQEPTNGQWWVGFVMVLLGVMILSNCKPANDDDNAAGSILNTGKSAKQMNDGEIQYANVKMRFKTTNKKDGTNITCPSSEVTNTTIKHGVNKNRGATNTSSRNRQNSKLMTQTNCSPGKTVRPIQNSTPSSNQVSRKTKGKENLKPESALKQYYSHYQSTSTDYKSPQNASSATLINRSFSNECALCEGPLFDEITGLSNDAIADLSTNSCFHLFHSKCLKHASKSFGNSCPICTKPLAMWHSSKQAAQFPGFWLERVEQYLKEMKEAPQDESGKEMCVSASDIRRHFLKQNYKKNLGGLPCITKAQKEYIDDDPTGMGKGLQATLEWGGYKDFNEVSKGRHGFSKALRTRGIWKYDLKKDDVWFWEWGIIHPRQRCDQCQMIKRPLPIACDGCQGSAEAAFYCSQSCARRDKVRHKQTCEMWKKLRPEEFKNINNY